MEFFQFSLSNGLRVIFKPTLNGQVGHCALMINAGSRDELPDEHGLAHFIEHGLFKGTHRRKAFHVLNRLDSVGGELNAYTTKEETAIYASFLKAHFSRSAEIIADIAFHATFPEHELKKEREVILDEIKSYLDTPSEMVFDDFEAMVFPDHPLGRSILGTEQSVRALNKKHVESFMGRLYQPSQMVFSVSGPFTLAQVRRVSERYFAELPEGGSPPKRNPVEATSNQRRVVDMNTHQVHYVLGGAAYPADHPLRAALVLVTNYLGGPAMNSKLSMNIRERHGIAYHIEASYQAYQDTGLFEIYLGTDQAMLPKAEKLVFRELQVLRNQALGVAQLHRAKEQLKGQIALGQEGGSNLMLALGKSLLQFDRVDTTAEMFAKIDSITASEILNVSNELLNPDKLSSLVYV